MTGGIAFPAAAELLQYGYLGVPFFFLISGYVILQSAQRSNALRFTVSRAARLYPAYWIAVPIGFLAAGYFPDVPEARPLSTLLVNLSMVQTFVGVPHVDGVYWTLTIELMFYGIIFSLMLSRQLHRLPLVAIALLGLATAFHLIGLPRVLYLLSMPEWSPYFIAGCALHWWQSGTHRRLTAVLLLWSTALNTLHAGHHAANVSAYLDTPLSGTVATLLTLAAFAALAAIAAKGNAWRIPGAASAGAISYPLYLLHQNTGYAVMTTWGGDVNRFVLMAGFLTALLAVCGVIALIIEPRARELMMAPLRRRASLPWPARDRPASRPGRRKMARASDAA